MDRAPDDHASGVADRFLGGDWPARAAETIETVVDGVRRKTTGPAIVASRVLVYGIVGAVLGVIAFVLVLITAVRLLDTVLPTWGVHLLVGGVLTLVGAFCWTRRSPRS
jgi:hypothetical protein